MLGTILIAVLVVAAGARAADAVRVRQQEIILEKLPTADAVAYYRLLRRRAWKVRVLRAIALISMVVILYHARNRGRRPVAPGYRSSRVTPAASVTTATAPRRCNGGSTTLHSGGTPAAPRA